MACGGLHPVKYVLKAYFGGCFGCLGALCATIALLLVLAINLGPPALGMLQAIPLPSILQLLAPGTSPSGQRTPSMGTPGASAPTDCYTTIDAWVSKSEMGESATTFSQTDGIFPAVTNPTDCGTVNARLAASRGQTLRRGLTVWLVADATAMGTITRTGTSHQVSMRSNSGTVKVCWKQSS